jgi:drug/metabolite transporter (DMT)-like permease
LVGQIVRTPAVLGGFAFYVVGALGWIVVLSRVDLSFAYPFLGLSYVTVPIVAVLLLGERFDRGQWIAVGAVLLGVTLVAGSG